MGNLLVSCVILSSDDNAFWSAIGPFALDLAVHRELGQPLTNAAGNEWVFASHEGVAAGFADIDMREIGKGVVWLNVAWVRPELRQRGVWRSMLDSQLRYIQNDLEGVTVLRTATNNPIAQAAFRRRGFRAYRQRGAWAYMERNNEQI